MSCLDYRHIAQIPQCTSPISHNAPFCNRNVGPFLLHNDVLWDICLMLCGICVLGLLQVSLKLWSWDGVGKLCKCMTLLQQWYHYHSVWTPFHFMYENSTLCTNCFVHQANTAVAFIVHQANAAGAFIVHQGNVVEHFGSYIKRNGVHPQWLWGTVKLLW